MNDKDKQELADRFVEFKRDGTNYGASLYLRQDADAIDELEQWIESKKEKWEEEAEEKMLTKVEDNLLSLIDQVKSYQWDDHEATSDSEARTENRMINEFLESLSSKLLADKDV